MLLAPDCRRRETIASLLCGWLSMIEPLLCGIVLGLIPVTL